MMNSEHERTTPRAAVAIFLAFASAYFLSALLRGVTATLAPAFSAELGIGAGDLGLLAGAYFLGFSLMQLPLGYALDRWGPKPVLLTLLAVASIACGAFAAADSLAALIVARAFIGAGVSACLMAPLTCYRRLFAPALQLRTNSWMLMTGSLGMLASTLPAQALLPLWGWRGLFWAVAGLLVLSMLLIAAIVPRLASAAVTAEPGGFREVWQHAQFRRAAPLGFVLYGGMIAVQALWAGPWLTRVAGQPAATAATGLLLINGCMLMAFMTWGAVMPRLVARGWDAARLTRVGVPWCLSLLALNIALGPAATAAHWALWCVSATVITPMQAAIGQAFGAAMAGRALTAYNLVVFSGVFALQWGIGLAVDTCRRQGIAEPRAFQLAFAVFWACAVAAYAWSAWSGRRAAR